MSRCLAEGTLRGYFDGELSGKEVASVTAHLAACEACTLAAQEMEEGMETLSRAFAPLISLPVPASKLKARLGMAISTLPPPKSGLAATASFKVSALFNSLSNVSNRMPRSVQAFAGLFIALLLFSAVVIYEPRLRVREQAKNEITPAASSDSGARAKPEEMAGGRASGDSSLSNRAQALSSGRSNPSPVTVNKVGLKLPRNNARRELSPLLAESKSLIQGEQRQLEHIAELTASIEGGEKPLNPILRVEYERNVAVVDVAIKATRRVALNNPRDKNARGFLLAAYQSKISLLRAVALHADPPTALLED
jgi:hypothetical protein